MITRDADGNLVFLLDAHAMDVEELLAHFLAMSEKEFDIASSNLDVLIAGWEAAITYRMTGEERKAGH
jgi:hypothetical protein